jgi:protein arginine kinase
VTLVERLVQSSGAWGAPDPGDVVAVSSRIRLARNIEGSPFPDWAEDEALLRLWGELRDILRDLPETADLEILEMDGLPAVDRQVLRERHLISTEMAERGKGAGVAVRAD